MSPTASQLLGDNKLVTETKALSKEKSDQVLVDEFYDVRDKLLHESNNQLLLNRFHLLQDQLRMRGMTFECKPMKPHLALVMMNGNVVSHSSKRPIIKKDVQRKKIDPSVVKAVEEQLADQAALEANEASRGTVSLDDVEPTKEEPKATSSSRRSTRSTGS